MKMHQQLLHAGEVPWRFGRVHAVGRVRFFEQGRIEQGDNVNRTAIRTRATINSLKTRLGITGTISRFLVWHRELKHLLLYAPARNDRTRTSKQEGQNSSMEGKKCLQGICIQLFAPMIRRSQAVTDQRQIADDIRAYGDGPVGQLVPGKKVTCKV